MRSTTKTLQSESVQGAYGDETQDVLLSGMMSCCRKSLRDAAEDKLAMKVLKRRVKCHTPYAYLYEVFARHLRAEPYASGSIRP